LASRSREAGNGPASGCTPELHEEPVKRRRDKGERRLVADGEDEVVVSIRRKVQGTMREDRVSGIELLTGRKALSFISDHDAHP
jgi:hypothetical protein